MLRNCRGPQRQRLLNKFTENDHEKVDRLLELHFKYLEKVELVDMELDKERKVCMLLITCGSILHLFYFFKYFLHNINLI